MRPLPPLTLLNSLGHGSRRRQVFPPLDRPWMGPLGSYTHIELLVSRDTLQNCLIHYETDKYLIL